MQSILFVVFVVFVVLYKGDRKPWTGKLYPRLKDISDDKNPEEQLFKAKFMIENLKRKIKM